MAMLVSLPVRQFVSMPPLSSWSSSPWQRCVCNHPVTLLFLGRPIHDSPLASLWPFVLTYLFLLHFPSISKYLKLCSFAYLFATLRAPIPVRARIEAVIYCSVTGRLPLTCVGEAHCVT